MQDIYGELKSYLAVQLAWRAILMLKWAGTLDKLAARSVIVVVVKAWHEELKEEESRKKKKER